VFKKWIKRVKYYWQQDHLGSWHASDYNSCMNTIVEIEHAVEQLPPEDLVAFRAWFARFDADVWDREMEADADAGRLDAFAAEALADLRGGRCTEL